MDDFKIRADKKLGSEKVVINPVPTSQPESLRTLKLHGVYRICVVHPEIAEAREVIGYFTVNGWTRQNARQIK